MNHYQRKREREDKYLRLDQRETGYIYKHDRTYTPVLIPVVQPLRSQLYNCSLSTILKSLQEGASSLQAVFALALVTVHVAAEIPSYIHVCGRRDPNLNQCILENVENLKNKICEGIPELDIESYDPLLLGQLVIFDISNSKLYINAKVSGLCDFVVNSLRVDIDKLHFDIDLLFKHIKVNGTYDLDLRVLVAIAQKAQFYLTTDNVGARVGLDMKMVTKDDKRYVFVSKLKINLDIKGYDIQFANQTELSQLREIVRHFVGNNQEQIIKSFKPALEESISKRIISVSNDIVKHFTYEEFFSDRT